jgi:flagellar basal body P-ring protein FlgI
MRRAFTVRASSRRSAASRDQTFSSIRVVVFSMVLLGFLTSAYGQLKKPSVHPVVAEIPEKQIAATPPALTPPGVSNEALIKDVTSVQGIRDNQLIGYGIVVGLANTGDSQMTVFPLQTLVSTLQRLGVTVPYPLNSIMVKNMAGVFVEATLPPFAQPGEKIDITISSTGDARSLAGGMLLLAPLYGPDGEIYAEAQGPLVVGGYSVAQNGTSKQINFPTTARIPQGAIVERSVPMDISHSRTLTLMLNDADFETATRLARTINQAFLLRWHMPSTVAASISLLLPVRMCPSCWPACNPCRSKYFPLPRSS